MKSKKEDLGMGSWAGLLVKKDEAAPALRRLRRMPGEAPICPKCKTEPRMLYSKTWEYRAYCAGCTKAANKKYNLRRIAARFPFRGGHAEYSSPRKSRHGS